MGRGLELDCQGMPGDGPFFPFLGTVHVFSSRGKSFSLQADSSVPAPTPHKGSHDVKCKPRLNHTGPCRILHHLSDVSLEAKGLRENEFRRNDCSRSAIILHLSATLFTLVKKEDILRQKSQLKLIFSALFLEAVITKKKKKKGT